MRLRQFIVQPVAVGLSIACTVTILLSHWFFTQVKDELVTDRQNREVIMQAMALADIVPTLDQISAGDENLLASRLQALLERWSATYENTSFIRIVSLDGTRFLASTNAADSQLASLPRHLQREEKWLYVRNFNSSN